MSKRKLTTNESVADILWFVEDGDDVDDGDAADDLNEIYDDDINNDVRYDKSDDDNSFDSDDGDPEDYNQRRPRKILIYKRLVNFMDKSLDDNCYDPHDLAVVEDTQNEMVLTGFLGPKKNPKTENISWTKKSHRMQGTKELAIFHRGVLNHEHYCCLPLEFIPSLMLFTRYFQMKWFN